MTDEHRETLPRELETEDLLVSFLPKAPPAGVADLRGDSTVKSFLPDG